MLPDIFSKKFMKITGMTLLLVSFPAHAYIGPGAGLTAIGSFLALLAAVLIAIIGFLWFPLKRLFKKRAARNKSDNTSNDA